MKYFKIMLPLVALATMSLSCKKEEKKIPVRTYTVTLSMQPTDKDFTALDNKKNVFLSLSTGLAYNTSTATSNSTAIDLALYDGTTTSTSIKDIHFVSPGGGTLSLNTAPTVYLYREPGTSNNSMRFFLLTEMDKWATYNTTKIRDESGMNGLKEANFDAIQYTDEYNNAISKIQQPGTDNSNVAKKMLTVSDNTLRSRIWYFEFQSAGGTRTALAKILDYKYTPDGYVTLQVKLLE